mmetsp:Transcript_9392/g.18900  ORF Transcript_9392/g.18900 Transcript_9392/m.18900 type:complete len:213 (+) Transcript_9392:111-749(+)
MPHAGGHGSKPCRAPDSLSIAAAVEQEVRGHLLILVAGQVRLDGHVAVEAKGLEPLHGRPLLLRQPHDRGPRPAALGATRAASPEHGAHGVLPAAARGLREHLHEGLGVLGNGPGDLGVLLLQRRQHLRERLRVRGHHLCELHEARIVPQLLQGSQAGRITAPTATRHRRGEGRGATTAASPRRGGGRSRSRRRSRCWRGASRRPQDALGDS